MFFSSGDGVPTIFVAVAGRSNGLGPVMSGNSAYPVINCPPITPDWGAQDIWSSLRMPSGTDLNVINYCLCHFMRDMIICIVIGEWTLLQTCMGAEFCLKTAIF